MATQKNVCLIQTLLFVALLSLADLVLAQNACTVNCGDKCTRHVLGAQIREPLCYSTCLAEKAACPLTGGATLPDGGKILEDVLLTSCGLPHAVALHQISSVCSFVPLNRSEGEKIDAAKSALVSSGLVRLDEFIDVKISFCNDIHGNGVVPDRDRVYLKSSMKSGSIHNLAALLAHEMEHVRQYRLVGTDNFKCRYTRQVGSCLLSNAARGFGNLIRDGYCQTPSQNDFERGAYDFQDKAMSVLSQTPADHLSLKTNVLGFDEGIDDAARQTMICQLPGRLGHCGVLAEFTGQACVCHRQRQSGRSGVTRAGGTTTLDLPYGAPWD